MNTFSLLSDIDFADGEILEVRINDNGVVVHLCNWRAQEFWFVFPEHHQVLERRAVGQDLIRVEILSQDPVLTEILEALEAEGVAAVEGKNLHRVDFIGAWTDPDPVLSVVANTVKVWEE